MLASQFSPWGCLSVFMTWQVASSRARDPREQSRSSNVLYDPASKITQSLLRVLPIFTGAGGRTTRQGSLGTILETVTSELYWYFLINFLNFSCCDSSLRVILSLSTESFVSLIPFPFLTFSDFLFFFFNEVLFSFHRFIIFPLPFVDSDYEFVLLLISFFQKCSLFLPLCLFSIILFVILTLSPLVGTLGYPSWLRVRH